MLDCHREESCMCTWR